jgi:hypothetical protein
MQPSNTSISKPTPTRRTPRNGPSSRSDSGCAKSERPADAAWRRRRGAQQKDSDGAVDPPIRPEQDRIRDARYGPLRLGQDCADEADRRSSGCDSSRPSQVTILRGPHQGTASRSSGRGVEPPARLVALCSRTPEWRSQSASVRSVFDGGRTPIDNSDLRDPRGMARASQEVRFGRYPAVF